MALWMAMLACCTDILGPQRMNPDDFGDSLTFHYENNILFLVKCCDKLCHDLVFILYTLSEKVSQ